MCIRDRHNESACRLARVLLLLAWHTQAGKIIQAAPCRILQTRKKLQRPRVPGKPPKERNMKTRLLNRTSAAVHLLALLAAGGAALTAAAQEKYPTRPIEFIVP